MMRKLDEQIKKVEGQVPSSDSLECVKASISKIARGIGYISLLAISGCGQSEGKDGAPNLRPANNGAIEYKVDSKRIGNPVFTVNDDGSTFFSMVYTGRVKPEEIEVTLFYYDNNGEKVANPITSVVQKNHNLGVTNAFVGKAPVSGGRVYAEAELRAKNGEELLVQKVSRVPVPNKNDEPSN